MTDLVSLAWPLSKLSEALEALARRSGLKPTTIATLPSPQFHTEHEQEALDSWLDWAAARLGIEIESIETTAAELLTMLRGAGPALLRYQYADQHYVLLLLKATAKTAYLISTDLRIKKCSLDRVRAALAAKVETSMLDEVETLLRQANIPARKWSRVKSVLIQEYTAEQRINGCWMLRIPPTANFWSQVSYARLHHRLMVMLLVFTGLYVLEIASWTLIGWGALSGRLDPGWLIAWVLILLSTVPLQLWGGWLQGILSIDLGSLVKQRLLAGALKMKIDEVRQQGVGQLLGRVMESQAIDALALNGGFSVLIAMIELSLAAWVLSLGIGGGLHVILLLLWLAITIIVCWRYYRRLRQWTHTRLELTHDLVERMVGHRTRLAQQAPEHRHDDEDQLIENFLNISKEFDNSLVPLAGGVPRGWLIIGLLGLAPNFVLGNSEMVGLAVGLGGILLAYRGFSSVASGLAELGSAAVAWEQISRMFTAANQNIEQNTSCPVATVTESQLSPVQSNKPSALVQVRDVVLHYQRQRDPVLDGCNLTIYRGDRLLLEGPSGSGKSTLAALLVGLRQPTSGILLLNGLDRATLGDAWRQLSTAAPQFHENHVLTETFAFNLLMGRVWPPSEVDLKEAYEVCDELGLGNLLTRMPSGLMQMVGETGWQLSHGERSRLYLARALLQKSELIVLDESFASLDPETLDQCLRCALKRASTLLVIAHP